MWIFPIQSFVLFASLGDFLKIFDQASKCLLIPLPKPKIDYRSTKSKDNRFNQHSEYILVDWRYESSVIDLNGFVYCPNNLCADIFCVRRMTSRPFNRSDYQCHQCLFTCQVHKVFLEEWIKLFPLMFNQGTYVFEELRKCIQVFMGDAFCPESKNK